MGFDPVSYAMGKQAGGGGGGGVTVEPLTVTENGTYTAPSGKAYSPVTVDVPGEPELITSYTLTESWENDTLGTSAHVCSELLGGYELPVNEYFLLVVEDNSATQYAGEYIVSPPKIGVNAGFCARYNASTMNAEIRTIANNTSFWVSVGATIMVYKLTVS